jgi:tryptophan synthase beta chain
MVKVSYEQKPFRRSLMHVWGAEVVASPSDETEAGKKILAERSDSPGSLGIAISEAVEDAAGRDDTAYSLGSVLNHVLLHQTVIGQEALKQMELAGAFRSRSYARRSRGSRSTSSPASRRRVRRSPAARSPMTSATPWA